MMISIDKWREYVRYNPEDGSFIWIKAPPRNKKMQAGDPAGGVDNFNGVFYHRVRLLGHRTTGHRLAWALTHGKWPDGVIDHKDGNTLNNRIENLRDVERSLNQRNMKKFSTNTSGFTGVTKQGNRWRAVIYLNNKKVNIGSFLTPEEASEAYQKVAAENGFTKRHGV